MCAVCYSEASPLLIRNEVAEDRKCKDLCKLCNCIGFYCGDECICECDRKDVESECDGFSIIISKYQKKISLSLLLFLLHVFSIKM